MPTVYLTSPPEAAAEIAEALLEERFDEGHVLESFGTWRADNVD